ncbi:hypothetical protein BKA81DRAFT_397815 [Phyllosticta paracitricarpa]
MSLSPRTARSSAPSPPSRSSSTDETNAIKTITSTPNTNAAAPSSSSSPNTSPAITTYPTLADDDIIGRLLLKLFPHEEPSLLLAPARRRLEGCEVVEKMRGEDGEASAARVLVRWGHGVFEFAGWEEEEEDVVVETVKEDVGIGVGAGQVGVVDETVEKENAQSCVVVVVDDGLDSPKCGVQRCRGS